MRPLFLVNSPSPLLPLLVPIPLALIDIALVTMENLHLRDSLVNTWTSLSYTENSEYMEYLL